MSEYIICGFRVSSQANSDRRGTGYIFIGISALYSFKSLKGCYGKEHGGVGSLSLE